MNISFLTSSHLPYDDRIFYHMAKSLSAHGNEVEIISSKVFLTEVADAITLKCFAGDDLPKGIKILKFEELLSGFSPEVIICSEPLTVLAAKQYSKKQPERIRIIYDITEWYPSKKNLVLYKIPFQWFVFVKLLLFNLWVSRYADSFIFGEWYKSKPYRLFFPGTSFLVTPYYPALKYINYKKPELSEGKLRLSYSGKISREKGFGNFINVLKKIIELRSDLRLEVKIIGWYDSDRDKEESEKLTSSVNSSITFTILGRQSLKSFIELIKECDIFIDLRSDDFENQHCLPIKIFYYAALGRPVIYSDLKAIRKEVDIDKFGFLVKPTDTENIAKLILNYLKNRELYIRHCSNARYLAEKDYNWQKGESEFITFVTSI
jgi:glycosyltransferase involved in cell wall biosynthesis